MYFHLSRLARSFFVLFSVAVAGSVHAASNDVTLTLVSGVLTVTNTNSDAAYTINNFAYNSGTNKVSFELTGAAVITEALAAVTVTGTQGAQTVTVDLADASVATTFAGLKLTSLSTKILNAQIGVAGINLSSVITGAANQGFNLSDLDSTVDNDTFVRGALIAKGTGDVIINIGTNAGSVLTVFTEGDITATTGAVNITGHSIDFYADVTSAGPLSLTGTGSVYALGLVSVASVNANSSGGNITLRNIVTTTGATIAGGSAMNVYLSGIIVSGGAFNIGAGLTGINISDNTQLILNSATLGSTFASPLVVTGSGTFKLLGVGTLTLSADSSAGVTEGDTINVTNATLNVTGKLGSLSTVTLTNGTLTGPGGTVGTLTLGSGTVIPRGTLNTAAVSFSVPTTYSVGVLTATTASNLKTASAINLGGATLTVHEVATGIAVNYTYTIINNTAVSFVPITGIFAGLPQGTTLATTDTAGNAVIVQISYAGGDGNDVTLKIVGLAPNAPTSVSALAGNGQAVVSFTAPVGNGGTAVTSYAVTATPVGGGTAVIASGSSSPITVTGLTNGTAYTFTVKATNSIGTSSASSASSSVIPLTVPGAPTAVSGVSGNTQAVVSFTAPTSNGGATITSYTVTATPPDGGAAVTAAGSASPITVTGLTNGTAYTFTAKATNSIGTGSASTASSSVIPVTVPGAPTALSGVSSNTQAVVQANYLSANRNFSGVQAVSNTDLLQTNLASVSRTGASGSGDRYFYREDWGYPVDLSHLTNGSFGGLGYEDNASVFPNQVTLTFVLRLGSTITSIRTFAGWGDTGRDGQAYTVQYSAVSDPTNFITLAAITRYDPDESNFPINSSGSTNPSTMVELTSSSGPLAVNVAAIRFVFGNYDTNTNAFENEGTAYREIDVIGSTGATAGNSQATLMFTAPSDNGGARITSYTITATPVGGGTAVTATGSTSPITVTGLTNGTAYTFSATATNSVGTSSASSVSGMLTPILPVAITTQPINLTVAQGYPGSFTVAASGTVPLTYQWLKNGVAISGATSATHSIATVATTDAGSYTVTITNAAGSVTSSAATLTVQAFNVLTANQNVIAGKSAAFMTGVNLGSTQWQVSTDAGVTWANLSSSYTYDGVTTNVLEILKVTAAMSKNRYRYQVTINNQTTTSAAAVITVGTPFLLLPVGVQVDAAGNLYISDAAGQTVRKISSDFKISTLAGNALSQGSTDGGAATAKFNEPNGLVLNTDNSLLLADTSNAALRQISAVGTVTTFAGTSGSKGSTDATGTAARFSAPVGLTRDGSGNYYVADQTNHTIRKISASGVVTTLAGNAGQSGSVDGTGAAARFNLPTGITCNAQGDLYVSDLGGHLIRKITAAGVVTTLAGQVNVSGSSDGSGTAARFFKPAGLAIDSAGNVYVADMGNSTLRKISASGVVSTLAGLPTIDGLMDGTGSNAWFSEPQALTLDSAGNIYVADTANAILRKVTPEGLVTTLALAGTAPLISSQPVSITISSGGSATFSVSAVGEAPLSYQWKKNGTDLSGAITTSYSVAPATAFYEGNYTVAVTNAYGTTLSNTATLTVYTPLPANPDTSTGSGGGGAVSPWFMGALGLLLLAKRVRRS